MVNDAMAKAGLTAPPSQTNHVFVKVPDANSLRDLMEQRGITVRGAYGACTRYSRVNSGKLEDAARYTAALAELAQKLWA